MVGDVRPRMEPEETVEDPSGAVAERVLEHSPVEDSDPTIEVPATLPDTIPEPSEARAPTYEVTVEGAVQPTGGIRLPSAARRIPRALLSAVGRGHAEPFADPAHRLACGPPLPWHGRPTVRTRDTTVTSCVAWRRRSSLSGADVSCGANLGRRSPPTAEGHLESVLR